MTYEKKTWIDDEVIERSEMQNIEDGINTAHDNIDSHVIDTTKHLTSAQNDGLDGANAPGSSNVFATILDIALTIDDTAYNESTWNGDTDAASKNTIRDKIVTIDSDIALNTTHKTSNGSDHTFIDQDVTNGSSPAILGTNITAIPANNINFTVLGTPTYETAQDWFNVIQTSGIISGFELSNSRSNTELDVAAGTGIIKTTDSEIGCSASFDFAGVQNVTLTGNNINYIYLDYNVGTPQIVATTNRASIELNRHFIIGRVYKNNSTLHILNAGVHLPNLARNEHERLVERDGFTYSSGAITSETGTLNLAITAGVWFLGHNRLTTNALDSSVADTWIYTHYGAASWITDNATASAVDTTHYNDGTDVLASLGSNNYGAQWVYISTDSHWYIIYDTINGTLSAAQAVTPPTSLPSYLEHMGELIAKIIHKQDGTIVSIEIIQEVEFTAAGIPNHNDTGSLQGGTANEYYHLTSAEKTLFDTVETNAAADQIASEVSIVDSGSIITAIDVEDALQENRIAIDLNTAKNTNVTTNLSEGSNTETTVDVNSSDGTNATLVAASTSRAGLLTKAKFDEIVANTSKVTDKVRLWLTVGNCDLPVTNPPEVRYVVGSTTIPEYQVLSFDDGGIEIATWLIPVSNVSVNARVVIYWSPRTTATATVDWDISMEGIGNGEDIKTNSPSTSYTRLSDTASVSTNNLFIIENASIATNCTDSELMRIALRMANVDADGDRDLIGILIEYVAA